LGESVTISVLVTNISDLTISHKVTLRIDNVAAAAKDVTPDGGDSQTVTFITAKDAAGIILASPVYYYNITAQLKAFIDRNRFYRRHNWRLKARSAGIIVVATTAGVEDATNALINFIRLSSNIAPEKIIQVYGFAETAGEIKSNTTIVEQACRLGRNITEELLER